MKKNFFIVMLIVGAIGLSKSERVINGINTSEVIKTGQLERGSTWRAGIIPPILLPPKRPKGDTDKKVYDPGYNYEYLLL